MKQRSRSPCDGERATRACSASTSIEWITNCENDHDRCVLSGQASSFFRNQGGRQREKNNSNFQAIVSTSAKHATQAVQIKIYGLGGVPKLAYLTAILLVLTIATATNLWVLGHLLEPRERALPASLVRPSVTIGHIAAQRISRALS